MHTHKISQLQHEHRYHIKNEKQNERKTLVVVIITLAMMSVEIIGGIIFGSMALLADGWHMGTHAAALGIAVFAYAYARKHANNPVYTFGTGKVGVLGGFTSAIILAMVALMMIWESIKRLNNPVSIQFNEAIIVAVMGLVVNIVCAHILTDRKHEHTDAEKHKQHHDHNLHAAYLHVLADALTSLLAIAALTIGKYFGWNWMDPSMGIVGALIISHWSYGLLRDSGKVLLDGDALSDIKTAIKNTIETDSDNRITDLHLWRVSTYHIAAIISIVTHYPKRPEHYKRLLSGFEDIVHITVEIHHVPNESKTINEHLLETSEGVLHGQIKKQA